MFKSKVIFLQTFPDATPTAMLKKADELLQGEYAENEIPTKTFTELLKGLAKDYIYVLRKDAEKESERFVSYAIEVCREYEIDTMIIQEEHEINVSMELYLGWHDNSFKIAFVSLLRVADDFTLASIKNKPEYVRITLSYHTHDKYRHGERIE